MDQGSAQQQAPLVDQQAVRPLHEPVFVGPLEGGGPRPLFRAAEGRGDPVGFFRRRVIAVTRPRAIRADIRISTSIGVRPHG